MITNGKRSSVKRPELTISCPKDFDDDDDDDDANRIDSIHGSQLVDIAGVRASISAPHSQPGPARRGSLFEAVRRASTFIGDGVCESRKELKLLGVLPEPEDSEDEVSTPTIASIDPVQYRAAVPEAISEDEEVYDQYGVSPTNTNFKASLCMPAPPIERTVTTPESRDFEAEQTEERAIRASLHAFTFDHPPPPAQTPFEQRRSWTSNYFSSIADLPFALPPPPQISRKELKWSKISPSTPLMSPWETFLFRQSFAHHGIMDVKLQIYTDGFEIPSWSEFLEVLPSAEAYERLSTEPAFCTENHLWEGRFPLEWKHYVRSGSL